MKRGREVEGYRMKGRGEGRFHDGVGRRGKVTGRSGGLGGKVTGLSKGREGYWIE
jgi:hypothetical protein